MFLFGEERRKPVPKTKRELLLLRQKGKCAGCRKSFKRMGVKPRLHHVGESNRIDALELLCPNCHSKAHTWKTRTSETLFGVEKERVLVKKRMGKAKKRKTRKKKKKTDEWSLF